MVFDRLEGKFVTAEGKIAYGKDEASCEIPFCLEDMCFLKMNMSKHATTTYQNARTIIGTDDHIAWADPEDITDPLMHLQMKAYMGTLSRRLNRYILRQIRLHF